MLVANPYDLIEGLSQMMRKKLTTTKMENIAVFVETQRKGEKNKPVYRTVNGVYLNDANEIIITLEEF